MIREAVVGISVGIVLFLAYLGYNVLPVIFLGGLLFLLSQTPGLRNLYNRASPGKSVSQQLVSFDDIGGQETARNELVEALEFITNRDKISRLGIRPVKGILLTGPPGTGKTLLAKAAAGYTNSFFLAASGSEFVEIYAGVGAQRVRELFRKAREGAKNQGRKSAIIFIDELEVLAGHRGRHSSHLEYDQTLNQLLVEMDGLSIDDEVEILVIGATNRIDLIDNALMRPGRFDRIVRVELPDRKGRKEILELHTRNKPLSREVDLDKIAAETFGFSGAHLENLANEAAILAFREGKSEIEQTHLVEAIDKVIMGEKLSRRPSRAELYRIAVHEAGHGIMAEQQRPGSVRSISVTSRGSALGYTRQVPDDECYLYTQEQIEEQIRVLLAGAVAEEVVLGSRSTGAADDVDKAVSLARRLVLTGMSTLGIFDPESLPTVRLGKTIHEVLLEQETHVKEFMVTCKEFLIRVADFLLREERILGEEFRRLFFETVKSGERVEG